MRVRCWAILEARRCFHTHLHVQSVLKQLVSNQQNQPTHTSTTKEKNRKNEQIREIHFFLFFFFQTSQIRLQLIFPRYFDEPLSLFWSVHHFDEND